MNFLTGLDKIIHLKRKKNKTVNLYKKNMFNIVFMYEYYKKLKQNEPKIFIEIGENKIKEILSYTF